jgi:hypothetical protein
MEQNVWLVMTTRWSIKKILITHSLPEALFGQFLKNLKSLKWQKEQNSLVTFTVLSNILTLLKYDNFPLTFEKIVFFICHWVAIYNFLTMNNEVW